MFTMKKIYLLPYFLVSLPSILADAPPQDRDLDTPLDISAAIFEQYGESFRKEAEGNAKEKEKNEADKTKKGENYDVARPQLSKWNEAMILLQDVMQAKTNEAHSEYVKNISAKRTQMPPGVWRNLRILTGPANDPAGSLVNKVARPDASQIEKCALALRLILGTYDLLYLKKEQKIIRLLCKNPALMKRLEALYTRLKAIESSLLALRDKKRGLDPMKSRGYRQVLEKNFPSQEGKFVSVTGIEFKRRFILEISVPSFFLLLRLAKRSYRRLSYNETDENWFLLDIFIVLYGPVLACFCLFFIAQYSVYKTIHEYIRGRLGDIQEFFAIAKEIDATIRSNPELAVLCTDKLRYTRRILNQKHPNPIYNTLSRRFQTHDFRNWGFFRNSMGTLMTTLTMIEDNIEMLDPMISEVGMISTSLAYARLVQNPDGNKSSYTPVELLSESQAYLKLKGAWNPSVDPNVVVENDIDLRGNESRLYLITGANGHGKTTLELVPAVAAVLKVIAPAKKASMTPMAVIFVFKDPQDDPSIKESLYVRELKFIAYHKKLIKEAHEKGLNTLSLYDEFLGSTTPEDAASLSAAIAKQILNASDGHRGLHVYSTHDEHLINFMEVQAKNKQLITFVHVETKYDETGMSIPTFKLRPGKAVQKDQNAIQLYEKVTGDEKVAKWAADYEKFIREAEARALLQ